MMPDDALRSRMERARACVVMPTFNNAATLAAVVQRVRAIAGPHCIVIDDGSTDATPDILTSFTGLTVLRNDRNRGKGFSLERAFDHATRGGYLHAITIDTDGQHSPDDLHHFLDAIEAGPAAMIMGDRGMSRDGIPARSSFGNRFSNFWFKVETGIALRDTQTGFRSYPLAPMKGMRAFTHRFEFEIETIVRLAWKGVPFKSVPVSVRYDLPDRVSHFRPVIDFARISALNTVLVVIAFTWYWPKKMFAGGGLRRLLRAEAVRPGESSVRKALSIGFGLFMGIVPIWGFQLAVGIPLAYLLRLNRLLFVTAAHVSVPPMIPLILFASYWVGAPFMGASAVHPPLGDGLDIESVKAHLRQYLIGSMLLASLAGMVGTVIAYGALRAIRSGVLR